MDPNATVKLIVEAIEDHDWGQAEDLLLDLRDWMRKGGFPPNPEMTIKLVDTLAVHMDLVHGG